MYGELAGLGLDADILFLDDNSPDGTGRLLDDLAAKDSRLHVIHRPGKLGIGTAHQDGIAWAYDHGYERMVTMDCDFTHSPADVPRLLAQSDRYDVVVGSRWLQEDSLPGWNLLRRVLTWCGHLLTRRLLGMPYDATGALRCYRLDRIPREAFSQVVSRGYSFFFESLFLLAWNGFSAGEVPIVLPQRTYGHSKMSFVEAVRSARRVGRLYVAARLSPERFRIERPFTRVDPNLKDPQVWDDYWEHKKEPESIIYDLVATVYRNMVIRRRLNSYIRTHFAPGSQLLHAGCGSGQVDIDLQRDMAITPIDISVRALSMYGKYNPRNQRLRHASIFSLPFADATFDGAYNLGVVEHFTKDEIRRIMAELGRVVRPGGKIVIFWPHMLASSAMVLDSAHWFFRHIRRSGVQFHPPEISRIRSRGWAAAIVKEAGLELAEYHFGPVDMFVQAVLIIRKPGEPAAADAGRPAVGGGA